MPTEAPTPEAIRNQILALAEHFQKLIALNGVGVFEDASQIALIFANAAHRAETGALIDKLRSTPLPPLGRPTIFEAGQESFK